MVELPPSLEEPHSGSPDSEPLPDVTLDNGLGTLVAAGPAAPLATWTDLALRQPGQAARAQAVALRQAAPVRTFLARMLAVKTQERAWRIGANGEVRVGGLLMALAQQDPRWHVLHAIPIGTAGSDIDHVAIGPAGVFTLNTKHHPSAKIWVGGNTLMINGQRQDYVRNSRFEAKRTAKLLSSACGLPVPVFGVIVIMGAQSLTIREQPEDVRVVARRRLVRWLSTLPATMDQPTVEHVFAMARRSTTWEGRRLPAGAGPKAGNPARDLPRSGSLAARAVSSSGRAPDF